MKLSKNCNMQYSELHLIIAYCIILLCITSQICDHLNKLQTRIGKLAKNSIAMVAKSVQDSAAKNAALFAKTMEIVNATSSKKSMNASEVATIISGKTIFICI